MFLQQPEGDPDGSDPLVEELANWLGRDQPVSILDFSGVPQQASDVAIGVILNLIFEAAVRTPSDGLGVGRPRPVLIVLEEAHRYLGETAAAMARRAANRIAREGRKYGVGLMLVTQRPSELPDTAVAQSGTLVALRLSNAADQAKIRAALPDSVAGLAAVLPSLRTGEAVITGEAIALPARTLIAAPAPFPNAHDPSLDSWRQPSSVPDVSAALKAWRGIYTPRSNHDRLATRQRLQQDHCRGLPAGDRDHSGPIHRRGGVGLLRLPTIGVAGVHPRVPRAIHRHRAGRQAEWQVGQLQRDA